MSKDLLKEAIADAKAVRETAIANAKLALEEAFTPKLQSMLSTKISEELEDEDEVELEDAYHAEGEHEDEEIASEMAHGDEEEVEEGNYEEDVEAVADEEEEDDLELEAIIRELEGSEAIEEGAHEDEEEAVEESVEESVEETVEESVEDSAELTEDEEINLDEIIKSLEEADEEEGEELEEVNELEEAYATIKELQATLQEVNLLNAKLLFSNKLFKSNNLSEAQKVKVIETFDRAANLREVKLVYSTLTESFNDKRAPKAKIAEGLASKAVKSTKPSKEVIVESNDLADRMKRLAGLL